MKVRPWRVHQWLTQCSQVTRAQGRPQCAYVNNFNHLAVFSVSGVAHRSALLKYKGRENYRSIVEPRLGAGEERRCIHMQRPSPVNLTAPG